MYSTNFEVAAFMLSSLCLIYCLTVKKRQYVPPKGFKNKLLDQHFVFIIMLLSNIISSAASVGGVYLMEEASESTAPWQYLLHACYFFFHALLSVSFCLYVMNLNGTSIGRSRAFYWMFFMPFLLSEALILTNSFTSFAFYMDSSNIYHRGPLMLLLYVIGGFYVEMGFYYFFRFKRAVPKGDSVALGAVLVMATLGILTQAIWPHLLLELFSESLACLAIMVLLEERRGHIDYVSGALNRVAFSDANRRLIETGHSYGVVLVGLADLDILSGLFSGGEIDELLMKISAWLISISSGRDVFCFRHTDFAIICTDNAPRTADETARMVLERFEREWAVSGMSLSLGAAVCVIRVPDDVSTRAELEELLSSDALRSGATRLVSFKELTAQLRDRHVEDALRHAVENGALRVWYQPIWSTEKRRTVAAEALLRVDDDELRALSPEEYIPIAEKTGLIREIGLFVFEEVCRLFSEERENLKRLEYIELNLSIYQFMYGDLVSRFEKLREEYGI
ncbi:MAG: EAL domain-containing protein, partial [Oscillospiraceae bacterium]|nr:EAL domain-containing protein [Oscillospiraceae bacterium]